MRISCLLLAALRCAGQPTPAVGDEKCAVEGTVVDAITGVPVRKAQVILRPSGIAPGEAPAPATMQATGTDASGNFSLLSVPPGTYGLSARGTGYERGEYGARRPLAKGVGLNLSPGKTVKDLVIKLVPQATLTGRVLDEAGDPVPQASVLVLAVQYRRGRRELVPLGMASSDDTGRYRVENVRPGKHYLFACSPGSGLGRMYYPGVQELSQASRVGAAPGAELGGLDFRLRKETGVRVRGVAVGENGQPLRDAFLTIAPREMLSHEGSPGAAARSDGAFELRNVPPGLHTLRMTGFGGDQIAVEKQLNVAGRDEENVVMVAAPASGLSVAVSLAGNAAKIPANGRILMVRIDRFASAPLTAAVEKDGTFALPKVLPTQYRVSTSGFGSGAYVPAVKVREREFAGREVDFAGGVPDRMEVVISMDGAGLGGTVQYRDLPFADATVVLVPEESQRDQGSLYRVVHSDNNGSFTMTGIPPGAYKLFAWEEIEPGVWQDREFLRPFEDRGVKVLLKPKAAESVRLNLIPTAE